MIWMDAQGCITDLPVTAVVLMGGQSSRMGQDKAKLVRNDTSMLEFTRSQLLKAGADKVVLSTSANREIDTPGKQSTEVADLFSNLGPLSGIYSVLTQREIKQRETKGEDEHYLFAPVDLPFLNADVLYELITLGIKTNKIAFVESQPLPLFIPASVKPLNVLEKMLTAKTSLSVYSFVKQFDFVTMAMTDEKDWMNCNTPEQWQQAKREF